MKKKPLHKAPAVPEETREFRISFALNEREYNAVCRYLDKYKIENRSRWVRETILIHVLQKLGENRPTLFNENEMRR
jgi:hypothetical protein